MAIVTSKVAARKRLLGVWLNHSRRFFSHSFSASVTFAFQLAQTILLISPDVAKQSSFFIEFRTFRGLQFSYMMSGLGSFDSIKEQENSQSQLKCSRFLHSSNQTGLLMTTWLLFVSLVGKQPSILNAQPTPLLYCSVLYRC